MFHSVLFQGPHKDGMVLTPLSGLGKELKKTHAQVCSISKRTQVIAGRTGAKITDETLAGDPQGVVTTYPTDRESYSIRFIQHASTSGEPTANLPTSFNSSAEYEDLRPSAGFGLKHGQGKRTTFSDAQRNIMVQFYDRQAINKIRAEPRDAMKAMEEAGLEVLTEKQIKAWWSTYHRKITSSHHSTRLSTSSIPSATPVLTTTPTSSTAAASTTIPIPINTAASISSSAPTATPTSMTTAISTTTPLPTITTSAPITSSVTTTTAVTSPAMSAAPASRNPPAINTSLSRNGLSAATTVPMPTVASVSRTATGVKEWQFVQSFSQSTIGGRNGSNACTLIALYMGKVASVLDLPPPNGLSLDPLWKMSLEESIIVGNSIHDDVYDHEGINLDVDEAIDVGGEICSAQGTGQQMDFMPNFNPKDTFGNYINELCQRGSKSHHILQIHGRAMLLTFDVNGTIYFVDSHLHGKQGAMIAVSPPNTGHEFATWLDRMMSDCWGCTLTLGSIVEVMYCNI